MLKKAFILMDYFPLFQYILQNHSQLLKIECKDNSGVYWVDFTFTTTQNVFLCKNEIGFIQFLLKKLKSIMIHHLKSEVVEYTYSIVIYIVQMRLLVFVLLIYHSYKICFIYIIKLLSLPYLSYIKCLLLLQL